jgi:hypothetical protein
MTRKIVEMNFEVMLEKMHEYVKAEELIKVTNTIETYDTWNVKWRL